MTTKLWTKTTRIKVLDRLIKRLNKLEDWQLLDLCNQFGVDPHIDKELPLVKGE